VLLTFAAGAAAAATIVVTPSSPNWSVVQETPNGSGSFVTGPATTPIGAGSLQLTVGPSAGGVLASTLQEAGRRLDSLSALAYSAYVVSAPNTGITASMQIDIDYDVTDGTTAWQGRLVYDPGSTGIPVTAATWVTYNVQTAPAGWWSTGTPIVGNNPQAKACTQAAPCTWAQVLAAYPNAGIRALVGAFGVKLGNFGGAGTVAVDAVVIGATTYNFEPAGVPPPSTCGGFTDVSTSDIYCSSVEWMANRGVTLGCTPTQYCPNDVVLRASMALFMNRLGVVLTPLPALTQQQTGPVSIAPFAVLCQTADIAAATYARTAINQYTMNLSVTGTPTIYPVLSTDLGATWLVYANGLLATGAASAWTSVSSSVNRDIAAGESVRFGVAVVGTTATPVAGTNCQLNTVLVNRNPAQSPLDHAALKPLTDYVNKP
jgi:hypothetical protein